MTTDYISNIQTPDGTHTIGGYITGGQWVWKGIYLASNISMNGNSTNTYNLDLPDDGCSYEIIGWFVTYTASSTNGTQADVYIQNVNNEFINRIITDRVRNSGTMSGGSSFRLIVPSEKSRKLKITTSNSAGISGAYLYWSWYRRIGTNG